VEAVYTGSIDGNSAVGVIDRDGTVLELMVSDHLYEGGVRGTPDQRVGLFGEVGAFELSVGVHVFVLLYRADEGVFLLL